MSYYIIGLIKDNSVYRTRIEVTDKHPDQWSIDNEYLKDGYKITETRKITQEDYEKLKSNEFKF